MKLSETRNGKAFKFSTKFAITISSFVVIMIGALSIVCSLHHFEVKKRLTSVSHSKIRSRSTSRQRRRRMKETTEQKPKKEQNDFDFSSESCENLNIFFDHKMIKSSDTSIITQQEKLKCAYARTCDDGDGVYAPIIYCLQKDSITKIISLVAIMVLLLLWMVVLFRMICSTAEDFFSPSLEMFSVQMGLPPRFAGVTLLALGNGAPDVASMLSAMETGSSNTYLMGIGELIGSSMFISTIISAAIVYSFCSLSISNQNYGVPCKGALVRDVLMLGLTMIITHSVFRSETKTSAVAKIVPFFLLGFYFLYTLVVLLADLHHRKYVLPRLSSRRLNPLLHQSSSTSSNEKTDQSGLAVGESNVVEAATKHQRKVINDESTPLKTTTYCSRENYEPPPSSASAITTMDAHLLHQHLPIIKEDEPCHHPAVDHFFESFSNYGDGSDVADDIGWGMNATTGEEQLVVLSHPHYLHKGVEPLSLKSTRSSYERVSSLPSAPDVQCKIKRVFSFFSSISNKERWNTLLKNEQRDIHEHLRQQLWDDIYRNTDINPVEKILLTFEMPFLILRMVRIQAGHVFLLHYNTFIIADVFTILTAIFCCGSLLCPFPVMAIIAALLLACP